MNETDLAWLAGFMEGEGTFAIYHQKRKGKNGDQLRAAISVTNTDAHLIVRCKSIFESLGCVMHIHEYKNKKGSTRPIYDLQTARHEYVKTICESLIPYLAGEKKAKATLLLSYVDTRLSKGKKPYDTKDWEHFSEYRSLRSSETTREASQDEDIVQPCAKV